MKTFLENLKKELKKRHFSEYDIDEILADHKEMIEMAKNDGLDDGDLIEIFGDPKQLAQDLDDTKSNNEKKESEKDMNEYTLYKTFPVLEKRFDVSISIVGDDIEYLTHDEDQIEVYYKNIKKIDNYKITFTDQEFSMEHKPLSSLFNFRLKSGSFIIKVPAESLHQTFSFKNVNGDCSLAMIDTNSFDLKTTSGDITLKNIKAETAKVHTVSGDINCDDFTLSSLDSSMVSGDAKFSDVKIAEDFDCHTVSGDVYLHRVKANVFNFKSVSGNCKGIDFYPENIKFKSVSGNINITNAEKETEVNIISKKTVSGDIRINKEKKS